METAVSVTDIFAYPSNVYIIKPLTERSSPQHSGPHGKTVLCVYNPFVAICRIGSGEFAEPEDDGVRASAWMTSFTKSVDDVLRT